MPHLVEFNQVSFSVQPGKQILSDISLTVAPDDFIVVLGSNGSGKSTLLKILGRSYQPTAGKIVFKNRPLQSYTHKELQHHMLTINQSISDSLFVDLTVEENAILIESSYLKSQGKSFHQKLFLKELPEYLAEFNKNLVLHLKTSVATLSGGEQQILAFALYLRRRPALIMLDEHTSALDPRKAKQVMSFIQETVEKHKIACIMTTHQLDFALNYGNRLLAIDGGRIAFEANAEQKSKLTAEDLLSYCY